MAKPIGSIVTITIREWNGDVLPTPGDTFRTRTGRLYEIVEIKGKRHRCRVIDDSYRLTDESREFSLFWLPRKPKS